MRRCKAQCRKCAQCRAYAVAASLRYQRTAKGKAACRRYKSSERGLLTGRRYIRRKRNEADQRKLDALMEGSPSGPTDGE